MKKPIDKKQDKFYEELVADVYDDFYARQKERRIVEKQWELNLNYLSGKQYCEIAASGEVEEEDKYYFWHLCLTLLEHLFQLPYHRLIFYFFYYLLIKLL